MLLDKEELQGYCTEAFGLQAAVPVPCRENEHVAGENIYSKYLRKWAQVPVLIGPCPIF